MCELNHSYNNPDEYHMVYKLHFPLQKRLVRCAPSWSNNSDTSSPPRKRGKPRVSPGYEGSRRFS